MTHPLGRVRISSHEVELQSLCSESLSLLPKETMIKTIDHSANKLVLRPSDKRESMAILGFSHVLPSNQVRGSQSLAVLTEFQHGAVPG